MFAVDADTGRPCGDFGRGGVVRLSDYDPRGVGGFSLTSPPVILGDLVIVAGAVGDNIRANAPDGTVRAFDVLSGTQRWEFHQYSRGDERGNGRGRCLAPLKRRCGEQPGVHSLR